MTCVGAPRTRGPSSTTAGSKGAHATKQLPCFRSAWWRVSEALRLTASARAPKARLILTGRNFHTSTPLPPGPTVLTLAQSLLTSWADKSWYQPPGKSLSFIENDYFSVKAHI